MEELVTSAYAGKSHVRRVEHLKVGGPSPGELVNRGASGVAVDWWVLPVPREGFSPPWLPVDAISRRGGMG